MRGSLLLIAALSALVNLTPVVAHAADEPTIEYRLALVQRNRYVAPDDPLVAAFGHVLDRLTYRCQETRLQLGNGAVLAVDYLQQQGVSSETPLSVLLGLDNAVPEMFSPDRPAKCGEYLGVLEYLLIQGV